MNEFFPFQISGANWLSGQKVALLADEMGLGKTATTILALDKARLFRVLILCPAVARVNWEREFKRFQVIDRTFEIIDSGKKEVAWKNSVICSYDLVEKVLGASAQFDALILDESHFLKSLTTKRTVLVLGSKGLAHKIPVVWALSGTPAPNHAGELWPLLFTFGRTRLKYEEFITRFCTFYRHRTAYSEQLRITGTNELKIPELREILKPIILRRKKEEVMKELPPIVFEDFVVSPGPVDLGAESSFVHYVYPVDRRKELFEKLERERDLLNNIWEAIGKADGGQKTTDRIKTLEGVAKSLSTLRMFTGIQKVRSVVDLVTHEMENKAYSKIVLFAVHRDVIEGLRVGLRKFGVVTVYGGTDPAKKQRNVDRFQKQASCRVFIGNIQAAGTAVTLTSANHVLFVEQSWVPGDNSQAAMRCHRIGQTKPVFVRFCGLANSIDAKVAAVLKEKTRQLTEIFDI